MRREGGKEEGREGGGERGSKEVRGGGRECKREGGSVGVVVVVISHSSLGNNHLHK